MLERLGPALGRRKGAGQHGDGGQRLALHQIGERVLHRQDLRSGLREAVQTDGHSGAACGGRLRRSEGAQHVPGERGDGRGAAVAHRQRAAHGIRCTQVLEQPLPPLEVALPRALHVVAGDGHAGLAPRGPQ